MSDSLPSRLPDEAPMIPVPARARDQVTDHNYDGIQEYDNPTPGWWVWIFVASIIFAFFYFMYYHGDVPANRSIHDSLNESVDELAKKKLAALHITELTVNEPNMLQWMTNPDFTAYGRSVFKQNCTSCHGENGQGIIGPNLTDDYYKNVAKLTDIPRVITNGANNGAMPTWQNRLSPIDIDLVATYVATLRGQNLPSGISPATYGDKIAPWPSLPALKTPATATAPAK